MLFVPSRPDRDGVLRLELAARPGLFQLSVVIDACRFDWDELYFELNDFGNDGRRTGPWDFNLLDRNTPLVPAYWVKLNGERLGLWFFQRVSLEDIDAKRFRGRAAFWVKDTDLNAAGEVSLEFAPYRPMDITWQTALWEADPEDILETTISRRVKTSCLPADDWNQPAHWESQANLLTGSHTAYVGPLEQAFDWGHAKGKLQFGDLPLLIVAHRLGRCADALEKALSVIDETIALSHWGNPREDGYSHDGDMGAAHALWMLAWSLRVLRGELGAERIERLKAKLRLQGERFMTLALLNRDYWGGSVLQDHGWRSHFGFGVAVVHLLGVLPEADQWLQYVVPRLDRALMAMPRDGVVPQSSYGSLFLHLDAVAQYREAWLACSGEDIYDDAPFHEIVDYIANVVREDDHSMILPNYNGGCVMPFIGGNQFLNQMAAKHGDGRAAYLQRLLLRTPAVAFNHSTQEHAFYNSALWGFLSYDPNVRPADDLEAGAALSYYPDTGLVHYRDREADLTLTLRCAPWIGWHADRELTGPCDAIAGSPGAGHFVLARGNTPLLVTPDSGYSLQSALCSCLLVDARGQFGDIGYPMSIPSWRYRGERVLFARWDAVTQRGHVRLNLMPAYAGESGVISYIREFELSPARVICRDVIQLDGPRPLSWLFQGNQANGLRLEGGVAIFGEEAPLYLRPHTGLELTASIHPTPVVYGYSSASAYAKFDHVRYDTVDAVPSALVEFVISLV